jgi:hypothetical protein
MLSPSFTNRSGTSVFVILKSDREITGVTTAPDVLSIGFVSSGLLALAVLPMVEPFGALGFTFTTSVKRAVSPFGMSPPNPLAVPPEPTPGTSLVVSNPKFVVSKNCWNVVLVGIVSSTSTMVASSGPVFSTVIS